MTYFNTPTTNPARADRNEMRRRATGVAGIAVRAAAYSGVRAARGAAGPVGLAQTPAEIPHQRDGSDPVGPRTGD